MIRLSLAALSLAGFCALAAPARADDVHFDFGFFGRDGHRSRGFFGFDYRAPIRFERAARPVEPAPFRPPVAPYAPPVPVAPIGFVAGNGLDRDDDCRPHREYVPPHVECREETVCEPAVYEDRVVPVFEDRCVPIFDVVCVPLFDERRVPIYDVVVDPRTGHRRRVVVGERTERVQIGERKERVKVGERHEQVEVGTRVERVLVRAETTRVVKREVWVPGRYVMVMPDARRDGRDGREGRFDERRFDRRSDGRFEERGNLDRSVADRNGAAGRLGEPDVASEQTLSEAEYRKLVEAAQAAPRVARR